MRCVKRSGEVQHAREPRIRGRAQRARHGKRDVRGHIGASGRERGDGVRRVSAHQCGHGVGRSRGAPAEAFVHKGRQRILVGGRAGLAPTQGTVTDDPTMRTAGRNGERVALRQHPGHPEIGHMGVSRGIDEHVGGLQVGVNDADAVRVAERLRYLLDHPQTRLELHRPVALECRSQRAARDEFARVPKQPVTRPGTVQGHDVPMLKRRRSGCRPMELLLGSGVRV